MSEHQQGPAWSGQPMPPPQAGAPWGPPATMQQQYPPQLPPRWQPGVDMLPAGGGSRSLPDVGKPVALVVAVALVAGGGYFGWKKLDKSGHQVAAKAPVAVPHAAPVAPSVTPTPGPKSNAAISPAGWDLTTVHPVTTPVSVAGLVIVYTADGGQLTINGIEPSNGAVVWSKPASVAQSPSDESFTLAHLGNTVFFYTAAGAAGGQLAEIEAVDAATGTQKWVTDQPASYEEMPELCSDNTALCTAVAVSDTSFQEVRTDVATGNQATISTSVSRNLGVGIWDAGSRNPEYVEHINDTTGATAWKDPVTQLFGLPVSSDLGSDWDSYGSVYVGWEQPEFKTGARTISFANEETVGVRASDGARLWRRPGIYGCGFQGLDDSGAGFAVRCVVSGVVTINSDGSTSSGVLNVTIQGFNVSTGATVWSDRLGNTPSAIGIADRGPVRVHADVFALTNAVGQTILINLKTGATAPVPPGQAGWCLQDGTFNITGVKDADGTPSDFTSDGTIAPCTAAGTPSAPTDGTEDQLGATIDGFFIWTSTDGLHAYKIGTVSVVASNPPVAKGQGD